MDKVTYKIDLKASRHTIVGRPLYLSTRQGVNVMVSRGYQQSISSLCKLYELSRADLEYDFCVCRRQEKRSTPF